jgi:hypothetical protein
MKKLFSYIHIHKLYDTKESRKVQRADSQSGQGDSASNNPADHSNKEFHAEPLQEAQDSTAKQASPTVASDSPT